MASIEDLLSTVSLDDLATLATIKSAGMDLGTGKRDVDLNDPLVYTTVEVEPAPLPEGTKLETRGSGLNQRQVLVDEAAGTNAFASFLKGLIDFGTFGISDHDKKGNLFGGEHGVTGYGREWDQKYYIIGILKIS